MFGFQALSESFLLCRQSLVFRTIYSLIFDQSVTDEKNNFVVIKVDCDWKTTKVTPHHPDHDDYQKKCGDGQMLKQAQEEDFT